MSGPPVILYWLGSPDAAVTVRANLLVFLIMLGMTLVANYAWHGLITPTPIALGVLLWPVYIVALAVGARWFKGEWPHPMPIIPDLHFRRHMGPLAALAADATVKGIRIVNCSPISRVTAFERQPLEVFL